MYITSHFADLTTFIFARGVCSAGLTGADVKIYLIYIFFPCQTYAESKEQSGSDSSKSGGDVNAQSGNKNAPAGATVRTCRCNIPLL